MEIEAKYRVDDPAVFAQVQAATTIGPFSLQARPSEHQTNTYFDTADLRLRAGRYGLRVRDVGERRVATLKGGGGVQGARHQREEWEQSIGEDDHPQRWPDCEVRDRVLALLDGAELLPVVVVQTLRHVIDVLRDGRTVAEMALDEGTIRCGNRGMPFREIEVELKGGSEADLDEVVAALLAQFALEPEEQSKLARGMALYDAGKNE